MGLKKFYYNLEDRYYSFVERTGLYKITDKIDKVMPSFVLFLLLILIIISGLIFLLLPSGGVRDGVDIQFKVMDADTGALLENISLIVSTTEGNLYLKTSENGLTEKSKVPKNSFYKIDISEENYNNFTTEILSKENFEIIPLALEPTKVTPLTVTYSFNAVNSETNQIIDRSGSVAFKCLNGSMAPAPMNFSNGQITVDAFPECRLAISSISFTGYVSQYDIPITNSTGRIALIPTNFNFEGDKFKVVFNVKNSLGEGLSNIKVTLTNNYGSAGSCITISTGTCTIEEVSKGEYTANYSDQRTVPLYGTLSKPYYLSENTTKTETLTTDVKGYVYVRVTAPIVGAVKDAEVSLKTISNNTIETKISDDNGYVIFTVPEIKDYNVVVDAEGYLIKRQVVTAKAEMPSTPIVIPLTLITPGTLASLKVKVTTWDGKGFKFAKVVLYDAETGFLTDYKPFVTNYDGNATINISSGRYIAKAIKGSVTGESSSFEFNVKFPDLSGEIIIPMGISEGSLLVSVVDKDGMPVPDARIDLYDRYSYYSFTPAIPLRSNLTNSQGIIEFFVDAGNDYYVVATDYLNDFYGKTQSRFVPLRADTQEKLTVTLYPKNSSTSKPRMEFIGIFKDGLEVKDNLKAGMDYQVRYNLLVPQNRTGDDRFEDIGFLLRTGSTSMIENDSLFIKHLDVPYLDSIQKYTQYNLNPPHESEGFKDQDSLTEGNFKWAKATLKEWPIDYTGSIGFYNNYEIEATISVKDTAVFGEELKIYNLGFGLNQDEEYETFSQYLGSNDKIEYYDVYDHITYGVGSELFCSTEFCFSSTMVDVLEDLRYDVTDSFGAKPNKEYKYTFTLINNSNETRYLSSRFILENIDEGLDIKTIKIIKPNGEIFTQNNPSSYTFDISITQLLSKQKVTGEIIFTPKLKGTRNLSIKFISDQRVRFINQLFIDVASDKTLIVTADPQVIPSGKNFNLLVKQKDSKSSVPVKDATVTIKDRFKDTIKGPLAIPNSTGELNVSNIPAQGPNDVIYVYVSAPEYETTLIELRATDRLFNIIPRNLAYSLNIFNEKQKTENFTINNIFPIDLTIEELVVKGNGLEVVDLARINNSLLESVGIVIKGYDTVSSLPDNKDASKVIPLTISLNPRAETIRELQNLSSTLYIVLSSGDNKWQTELPIKVNIGFDGMIDNSNCLTISNGLWKDVSINKPVQTNFIIANTCSIKGTNMPLSNGLEARVLFESNPQGKFIVSIDNRSVELTHGNYRNLLDTFDRDRSLPVVLKYEPIGRMKGTVKGKVQFRSINNTGNGSQEIVSEIAFEIDVTNLKDCVVFSKNTLNVGQMGDSFTIENKACSTSMVYRLSCDDCIGLIVDPRGDIEVSSTGTSQAVTVSSMGATPGAYVLNVYGAMKESRQDEDLIKRVKVYVRPTDYCLDLERYEFDLYRSETSESTGLSMSAIAYDVTNIINLCYSQEITGQFTVKENAKWKMAFVAFLREGIYTTTISAFLQGKIFALAEDKANKLLKSVEGNNDSDVITAATALKAAIAGGDKKKIKEATTALEAAVKGTSTITTLGSATTPGTGTATTTETEDSSVTNNYINLDSLNGTSPNLTNYGSGIEMYNKLAALEGIQKTNKITVVNFICNYETCSPYAENNLSPGDFIGYTSPSSSGAMGYFAIYLGEKAGSKKILRISGSTQQYLVQNLSEFNVSGYIPIQIIK